MFKEIRKKYLTELLDLLKKAYNENYTDSTLLVKVINELNAYDKKVDDLEEKLDVKIVDYLKQNPPSYWQLMKAKWYKRFPRKPPNLLELSKKK